MLTRRTALRLALAATTATAIGCGVSSSPLSMGEGKGEGVPTPSIPPPTASTPRPALPPTAPPADPTTAAHTSDWDELIAAARREGHLSLVTLVNRGWADVIARFEADFQGIKVQRFADSSSGVWTDAIRRGRAAGVAGHDLAFVQPGTTIRADSSDPLWAPIRPILMRPDVVDDRAWRGGLDGRFLDLGATVSFDWEHQVHHTYIVKTDLVGEGEITSVRDLLDPKWRGRVLSSDPRIGDALMAMTATAKAHGEEILRPLLVDQKPALIASNGWSSAMAAEFVRGPFAIARSLRPKPLADMRAAGQANNLRWLDLPDADFVPSVAMMLVDAAPHPAAAKLFANWILTRDGQALLAEKLPTNSARIDVPPFDLDGVGKVGNSYYDPDLIANEAHAARIATVVRQLLG